LPAKDHDGEHTQAFGDEQAGQGEGDGGEAKAHLLNLV